MDGDENNRQQILESTVRAVARANERVDASNRTDDCVICLQPISDRAVVVPCNHYSFDFICVTSWLQERSTCPLCMCHPKTWRRDSANGLLRQDRTHRNPVQLEVTRRFPNICYRLHPTETRRGHLAIW